MVICQQEVFAHNTKLSLTFKETKMRPNSLEMTVSHPGYCEYFHSTVQYTA